MDNVTVTENTNSYTVTGLSGMDNYNVTVTTNNSCGMMMSDPITVDDKNVCIVRNYMMTNTIVTEPDLNFF